MSRSLREDEPVTIQMIGEPLPDFVLPSLDGERSRLDDLVAGRRGALVVFWSGVCSHCVRYDEYLNRFSTEHPELRLVALASREAESPEQLRATAESRALRFLILHDAERRIAHDWLVRQTPRVFLIDGQRRLLYRGAIDNFKYPRDSEHEPYLEDAIADFLGGRPMRRQETPSFGCPVESVYYTMAERGG